MALSELRDLPDVTFLGLPQPKTFTDFFKADMKIVPGIRSIELLPALGEADVVFLAVPFGAIDDVIEFHFLLEDERYLNKFLAGSDES